MACTFGIVNGCFDLRVEFCAKNAVPSTVYCVSCVSFIIVVIIIICHLVFVVFYRLNLAIVPDVTESVCGIDQLQKLIHLLITLFPPLLAEYKRSKNQWCSNSISQASDYELPIEVYVILPSSCLVWRWFFRGTTLIQRKST